MAWLLLILTLISITLKTHAQSSSDNYGPYDMSWRLFETCKGPKQKNCGDFQISNVKNMSDVIFHLDFPKDCPATTARITISSIQGDNSSRKLWNYALNEPCEHFVLGPILVESFNMTSNCKVNKGRYEIHLNFKEKAIMFLGSNFFYGTYSFKVMSYNKISNFFCVISIVDISRIIKS